MKKPKQLQQSQNPLTIALTNGNFNQTSNVKAKQKPKEQSPTTKASEIPQLKQACSISIYTPCGKEDKKEGNQIRSCYSETVE